MPGSNSSPEGSFFVYPTLGGAHEFPGAVVQPAHRLGVPRSTAKAASGTSAHRSHSKPGRQYIGRRRRGAAVGPEAGEPAPSAGIKALDPETGKTMWDFKIFQGSLANGVLATGGNVVFAAIRDGNLVALDARTRQAPLALPDRRQHERVADELRGRRAAVRRRSPPATRCTRFALPE